MSKLNVVITSGGTREYLDSVRVLTNISTGKLGAIIANEFISHGHDVHYVGSESTVLPSTQHAGHYSYHKVFNVESVMEVMKEIVPKADVVIQSMAVSDFTFDLKKAIKVSGTDAEAFVEHIRQTITKTPKVISNFRTWNPKAILVGFKFTVGKDKKELEQIARNLMNDNKLDMVFANDKEHMKKAKEHVGTLIMKDWSEPLRSKEEISTAIYTNVMRLLGK
jgi:phosphopantothenate-cysteine ligase